MVAQKVEIFRFRIKKVVKLYVGNVMEAQNILLKKLLTVHKAVLMIILHIAEDSEDYLENHKIEGLLKKYCKFLPVEIKFGTKKEWIDKDVKDLPAEKG
jgi:molecular chaperone HtpG